MTTENENVEAGSPAEIVVPVEADVSAEAIPVREEPVIEEKPTAKVVMTGDVFSPLSGKWDKNADTLHLPGGTVQEVRDAINDGPNIRLDDSAAGREWSESLRESTEVLMVRGIGDQAAQRPEAEYHQRIDSERGPLCAGIPNLKFNTGEKVSGERAVLRVRSLLGMGTILQIPLWHSGFWVTLKAPSEGSLLELQRRLIEEKINLGRNTHGLAYANTSVFIAGWLIDFAMAHIYDITVKGEFDLRKKIKVLDIPTIIWGLACTIWPSGFQYSRACIADPEKCNHVIHEKLNLSKILWVDRNSLTQKQINHMMSRGGTSMTPESVDAYQAEFQRGMGRTIKFGPEEQIAMTFKVPNVDEYIESGYKWINNIVSMIDAAMTTERNDTTRNIQVAEMGKATNMRQYAHWIESIDANGMLADDVETIEQIVDTLSSEDDIRVKYFTEVIRFIDDATMSLIAVPTFECPACNQPQKAPHARFPHLLPIDVMSSFFTLVVQKLQKIHTR